MPSPSPQPPQPSLLPALQNPNPAVRQHNFWTLSAQQFNLGSESLQRAQGNNSSCDKTRAKKKNEMKKCAHQSRCRLASVSLRSSGVAPSPPEPSRRHAAASAPPPCGRGGGAAAWAAEPARPEVPQVRTEDGGCLGIDCSNLQVLSGHVLGSPERISGVRWGLIIPWYRRSLSAF